MKVLIICDDIHHHEEVIKGGLEFLHDEFDVTFAAKINSPLTGYDVVIMTKDDMISKSDESGWLTPDIEQEFSDYANNGGGVLFIHAGVVICRESATIKNIAGCAFEDHPEQCVVDFAVTAKHPITDGVANFAEKDEHYFIDFTATDADIFMESRSPHGTQPAGYSRSQGKGRVCVLTPGHNLEVFQNGEYKKMIGNAVRWCASVTPPESP